MTASLRWLLIDEIVCIEKGRKAITRSRVPDYPWSAELLIVEMMAQTGGLLVGAEADFRDDLIFAKVEKAEFLAPFKSGQMLEIEAASENLRSEGAWIDAVTFNEEKNQIAHARLLLTNVGKLSKVSGKSVTFHDAFMNHFQVRSKVSTALPTNSIKL